MIFKMLTEFNAAKSSVDRFSVYHSELKERGLRHHKSQPHPQSHILQTNNQTNKNKLHGLGPTKALTIPCTNRHSNNFDKDRQTDRQRQTT